MGEKYKDLSYKITGAAYLVGQKLGCGFLEKVYETALCHELRQKGLKVERQKEYRILYDGIDLGLQYFADIVVEDLVIIEIKALCGLENNHRSQLINYLKASRLEFGMLINFGAKSVQIERFANYEDYKS